MNVALIHDYLENKGGAEAVFEKLIELFPKAEKYTLFHDKSKVLKKVSMHTSFIQKIPFKDYRKLVALFPLAVSSLRVPKKTEIILSSSHAFAKGIRKNKGAIHICYCHTPMRYAWDMYEDYLKNENISIAFKIGFPIAMAVIRKWDYFTAKKVDYFIANSKNVQERIKKYYRKESTVIYPPVRTKFFTPQKKNEGFYLIVSRLVSMKRIDIAVDACTQLNKKLVIVGGGRELERLKKIAGKTVEFKGELPDEEVRDYYRRCKAFIFTSNDDFGITPVEAQACGKPVIAFAKGGALETVIEGKTGHFFSEQTSPSLIKGIKEFEEMSLSSKECRKNARRFDEEVFKQKMMSFIQEKYKENVEKR
jgi:glycosyltransferase involved in cell wall biosynthesis